MKLTIFSLQDVIQEYNQENGSQYSKDENFNLLSLSSDALARLDRNLKDLSEVGHNSNADQNSYKKVTHHIDESHYKHLKEREAWYEDQVARFEEEEYWSGLLTNEQLTKARQKTLVNLQKLWSLQKDCVNQSSAELGHIVTKILPEIIEYIRLATEECRHNDAIIPEGISYKFMNYLQGLSDEIRAIQNSIVKSMLVRLKIAFDSRNWKFDDAVVYVSKKVNLQRPDFQSSEGINLRLFCIFLNCILLHGSADEKMSMCNGEWFQSNVDFSKVKHGKRYCVVPKEMVDVTPRFYFSSTLFAYRYFRHNFFHENIGLIVRLKTLESHTKVSKHMSAVGAEKIFDDLMELEVELKRVHAVVEAWRSVGWKRHFRKKTNKFVSLFAHFSLVNARKIAEKRLEVIHVLRLRIETDYLEGNQAKQCINLDSINRAIHLCENCQLINKDVIKNPSLTSQFEDDYAYFSKILLMNEGEPVSIASAQEATDLVPDPDVELTEDCSSEIEITPKEIEAKGVFVAVGQVNPTSLTDSDFDQLMSVFERTIDELPPGATDEHLNLALTKHFISYLEYCGQLETQHQFMEVKERVQKIEVLFEHRGPAFIKKRLALMIKLRDQESDWFGFKSLCGIYLQSCALQETNQCCPNLGVLI